MARTEEISTHDIEVGDLILHHGMRLRVNSAPRVSTAHRVESGERGATLATLALIENWDEIAGTSGAANDFIVSRVRSEMARGAISEPRWTIQGNGLARWERATDAG